MKGVELVDQLQEGRIVPWGWGREALGRGTLPGTL